jgi:hypothetical protein
MRHQQSWHDRSGIHALTQYLFAHEPQLLEVVAIGGGEQVARHGHTTPRRRASLFASTTTTNSCLQVLISVFPYDEAAKLCGGALPSYISQVSPVLLLQEFVFLVLNACFITQHCG